MKLTITILALVSLSVGACDSLTEEQTFQIEMLGSAESAEGATGNDAPNFQVYTLREVAFINSDGSNLTQLFDPSVASEEDQAFRIIDRAQVVYSKTISDLVGQNYSGIRLSFDPAISGGNRDHSELAFTLAQATLILTKVFSVEKATSLSLEVKVKWGDTIDAEQMSEPSYVLSLD